MRALVLVVVLQWALAIDMPIMTKSSYMSTSDHCTPGYFRIVLDSGELCIYCICWGDVETCGAMQYRRCLGDDVVVRRLRHKRNTSVLSYSDVLTKDFVRKRNLIKLDEVNPEKQREIYIKTSKAKAFNARKQSDSNSPKDVRDADAQRMKDNEIFGVFKRDGGKETGKILEEQQTLALIRNSRSRVIHTGNVMSVTSKPRFVRSHKKENGIKLNIKQKRTSFKKDLAKKFKKPSFYRTKRHVDENFFESKNNDVLSNITETPFQTKVFTDTQPSTVTTETISTIAAQKTTVGGYEETTVFDTETPEKTSWTSNWSSKESDVTNFYTTEQSTDTVHPEITKHLYDVTENIGEVADVDIPSLVNKIHVIAEHIPGANDIKFKDWNKLDKVENNSNMFHWTKEDNDLSARESILLRKFKRIFRKKSNVIRTKPFTVDKSDRIFVTNVPSSSVANIKTKFPNAVFKNITNIQHLLKEILMRLKAAHANEKTKEMKIDNDFIWRLKDHERKIKKHSHLLTSYKNLGSCAINTRKKLIIDSKVNELHNHTKNIFESIEFLKNVPTAASTDRIIIKNNTEKFVNSVGKFAYLLNEIINIATCKRNNKLQRIMRHISRRQSDNPKVNEAVSKMKLLIGRYSAVQNTFVSKMYEAIHNFDDNNTSRIKSATAAANTSKINNAVEMDAITMKITKNLMRLKDLVQNLNKGGKVKRALTFEEQARLNKGLKHLYTSQSTISVAIPFYKEVNELITKIVGSLQQLKNYLQDMIPNNDASKRNARSPTEIVNFTRNGFSSQSYANNKFNMSNLIIVKFDTTPVEKIINMTLTNLTTPKIAEEITKNLTSLFNSLHREKSDATNGNDLNNLLKQTVNELHDLDIAGNINDTASDPTTTMYKNYFGALNYFFTRNLNDLKEAVEESKGNSRTKREIPGDGTMDLLLLVEYMLKQKLAVRRPPVEDGIDALIEAIRKAPDVRTVKNKILGINITNFNISKTSDESGDNKYDENNFGDSNHIGSKIDRSNRDACISDISSDDNSDTRLDDAINNLNENRSHEVVSEVNKEMDEFDSGLEDNENIRPVEVDNNQVDETTPADITEKYDSDSVESSEKNIDSKVEVINIEDSSDEHKKLLDPTKIEDDALQDEKQIDHDRRYMNRYKYNVSQTLRKKHFG